MISNLTSAFIGDDARVNQDSTGRNAGQGVLVAAGSDDFGLGIDGFGSTAGLATVGPAGDAMLGSNTTTAYIGTGAVVGVQADVQVLATAAEYIDAVVTGFGVSAGISVVPSLAIISLAPTTLAYIDQDADVSAVGNVLVQARDDTHTDILVGSLGVGFLATAGSSFGETFVTKDTEAYVAAVRHGRCPGAGATGITAYSGVINGTSFGTSTIHGLGVEAESSENLVTTVGSGAAGAVVAEGAFSITIDQLTTKAHIDDGCRDQPGHPRGGRRPDRERLRGQ